MNASNRILNHPLGLSGALALLVLSGASAFASEPAAPTNAVAATKALPLPTLTVKDYLKEPAAYAGREIVLQGFVTEVCKRKGCWALLHDADSEASGQVRVKQDDEAKGFKAFLPELLGHSLVVTAAVQEVKIDKAYLERWETNVKNAQAKAEKSSGEKSEAFAKTLKQIAEYRERVAKSDSGHLASYSLAVINWREAAAAKEAK